VIGRHLIFKNSSFCKYFQFCYVTEVCVAGPLGHLYFESVFCQALSSRTLQAHFKHIIIIISGVRLSSLGTAATAGLLYQPQMIDEGDCGATGGMKVDRGNRSTRRKPAPVPLCPSQIPHDLARARTQAVAVGSQQLTA
jgi:hypothetical protein